MFKKGSQDNKINKKIKSKIQNDISLNNLSKKIIICATKQIEFIEIK